MLRTRLIVSAILIPLFIALCWLDAQSGGYAVVLMPLALALTFQGAREFAGLLGLPRDSRFRAILAAVAIVLAYWMTQVILAARFDHEGAVAVLLALGAAALLLAILLLGLFLEHLARFRGEFPPAPLLAGEFLSAGYIGLLMTTVAALRWVAEPPSLAFLALGSLIIGAKVGDIGGYSIGRLLGKRKLAPLLSPGKTWAGAIGAIVTAAVGTAIWIGLIGPLFVPDLQVAPWPLLLLFGTLLGVVGLLGDLAESLLKRGAGAKDASQLLPAFGGLLDLIDSILFAAPIALLVWLVWPPAV